MPDSLWIIAKSKLVGSKLKVFNSSFKKNKSYKVLIINPAN